MKTPSFFPGAVTAMAMALLLLTPALAPAQEDVVAQLEREKLAQTGTAITIIFDDSGSMNQNNKLPQAKAAFKQWLASIPEDVKLSLITFQGGSRVVIPLGEKNRDEVLRKVSMLTANSSTPICAALGLAERQIRDRRAKVTPYERQVVLLFTDGEETEDRRGADGVRQTIGALRAENIEVAGVGFHGQGDYMNGVATRYYSAGDEASLVAGLAKVDVEIGDAGDLVISPEELKAMKNPPASAPERPPGMAANPASSPEPTAAAAPARERSKGFNPVLIGILIVGFLIVRGLFNKTR